MQTVSTPDGQVYQFPDTMSREQMAAAIQARLAKAKQPQAPAVAPAADTSMGTAFKVGEGRMQAAVPGFMADANRQLSEGPLGTAVRAGQEYVGNPVREFFGFQPIDQDAIDREAEARLQTASDTAAANTQQLIEDTGYQSLQSGDVKGLASGARYVGQKLAESGPMMLASIATGGTITPLFTMGEANESLKEIEGLSEEDRVRLATSGGAIMAALENLGLGKLIKGGNSTLIGGIANGIVTEGVTEAMQEAVLIGTEAIGGKEFSEGEITNRLKEAGIAGGAVGGSVRGGVVSAQKTRNLFTSKGTLADPMTLEESYRGAAGDVARQLKEIATVNNYNLKDIGTGSNGARQALEDIRSSNVSRINDLRSTLKDKLNIKNAESLDELLSVYSEAKAGIAAGKKKVSQKVTTQQLDAIKQLVGPYKEGAQLLNELQKSNVITDLFKDGVKGGISQFTDLLNPFSQSGAVYDPSRMANVATGLILPAATGGASIKMQAGGFALGRMLDAATGRRSKVARFVNKNLNSFGLPDPEGPSLVEQKALNEAQSKERRLAIAEVATALNAPKPGPLESMTLGTGLDRAGLETVVNKMAQDFANSPEFTPVLEDISKNLAGEGNRIDALTEIIPVIGAYAQKNTPELLVAPPDNPGLLRDFNMIAPERLTGMQTAAPQQSTQDPQQSGRQFTSPENYQAGIDANFELADTLQSTLSADPDVSVTDKDQLLPVLEGLKQPLTNPTVQLQTDIEALQRNEVSSEAIDKYVRPYLDRVTNQREQRSRLQRLQDAPKKPTSTQTEAPTPTEAMTEAPVVPQTAGEMVAEGSIIEGAVRAISEGTMAPESVDAMLSSLEASTPGIRAKIEAIVNRQPPEGPAAPALTEAPALTPEAPAAPALTEAPAAPALAPDNYSQALNLLAEEGKMATSWLQRKLGVRYSEAETLVNRMEAEGYISAPNHVGKREVLVMPPRQQDDRDLEADLSSPARPALQDDFKVTRNDASETFGAETERVRYTDEESGGTIEVLARPDNTASVLELSVPDEFQGKGVGQKLQQRVLEDFPSMGGQVSSKAAAVTAYRLGRRPVGKPDATIEDVFAEIDAMSSVNLVSPEMQSSYSVADQSSPALLQQDNRDLEEGFEGYLNKVNPDNKRIAEEDRPNLMMGDMYGMLPRGSEVINEREDGVTFHRSPNGDYFATAYNPDVGEQDVVGYIMDRGNSTELQVVAEMQNQGIGSELQYMFRSENPNAPTGGLTEAGEGALSRTYDRMFAEGIVDDKDIGNVPSPAPAAALSDFIRNGPSQLRRAFSRRVPSKQEVVGQFPAVKALFEIGKKGSPYENGITNIEDALTLAKALGITVHMFNDHQKMLETLGADSQTLRGRFVKTSNGASGHVFALEPGTDYRGRNLTDIEALTTLLHEIFHGVTMGPMSGVGPMLNGNGNGTPSVENAVGAMIDKPQGKRTPQERKILREITRLQNSLSAYVEGKPTERRPVRGLMAAMDNFDQQRNQMTPEEQMDFENKIDAHVKYIRSKGEFSVDPFWVYAVNPKMAKLVMPETTKWIRGELRKAGNKDIQFFTHPLAISIAVVMALMASEQAEDEQEEQQRQQMQPGALSPNAGMLSAA